MRFYFSEMNQARRAIKMAWIAGLIYSSLAAVSELYLLSVNPTDITSILFIALLFGLTLGIYQKRSTAAIVMFALTIINALIQVFLFISTRINPFLSRVDSVTQLVVSLALLLPFIYCFWQGMRGVLSFHRLQNTRESE
ncbi:MAG: hypothetical protein SFY66_10670 [Oculatellaceae cyanobacterium bins.114]|nr:hypothetical protein [Oculatellaceae cyanobacterium bins.114]